MRDILDLISHSREDAAPVFDALVHRAADLCGAEAALLVLGKAGDRSQRLASHFGIAPASVDLYARGEVSMDPDVSIAARAILTGKTIHIPDMMDTEGYRNGVGHYVSAVRDSGVRSQLFVPLMSSEGGTGCILVNRKVLRPFSPDEIALVETFAAQAVIAIDNARQFSELQERLAREAATREILEVISQSRDDEAPVFAVILGSTARLCKTDLATLDLVSAEGTHLEYAAHWGTPFNTFELGKERWPLDPIGQETRSVLEGVTIHTPDLKETDLYRQGFPTRVRLVEVEGVRTYLTVPLITASRQALGVICLYRKSAPAFAPDEIALVETFAAQAVIAIENVRQFRAIQAANAELETRLAREAATREILTVISQSRDNDAPVFDVVLRKSAELCGASMADLELINEERTHSVVTAHWGESLRHFVVGATAFPLESETAAAIYGHGGQVLHVHDMADSDLYRAGDPIRVADVDKEGIRTFLAVPLISSAQTIGCITLYRRVVSPFAPDEIALVETFAAQAVIAIENVRQFRAVQAANAELETRLAREAATREILEVISQSRDDDRPVFDAILQNATRLCGADSAALLLGTPEGPHLTLAALQASNGLSTADMDRFIADINRVPMAMDPALHISARAICSAEVIHIEDLAETEGYLSGEPSFRFMVEDQGVRTTLSVPIFDANGPIGCISVHRNTVRPYGEDEIALIQSFAAQAVIAIENARQFRELQKRLAREAATREILEVISQSRDDERPVFDVILRKSADLCGASMADLEIINEERSHALMVAHWGETLRHYVVGETAWPLDTDLAKEILSSEGRFVHVHDMADTEHYRSGDPHRVVDVDREGIRTFLAVPLFTGKETLGCISLYRREVRPFAADEIALVETFAAQAVIAIENVRQFRAVQTANAELEARLSREAATREILEVISHSRDDDRPVFDAILHRAAALCGASAAALVLGRAGDTHQVLAAHYGVSPKTVDIYAQGKVTMDPAVSIAADAILSGAFIHIEDMAETEGYRQGLPQYVSVVRDTGVRTELYVPLIAPEGGIGCLIVFRTEVLPFTEQEIALVQSFAAQAVIAVENVRQFRALQQRLAREAATREILEVISQSRDDYTPVFDAILRSAAQLCSAPMAWLLLVDDARTTLTLAGYHGESRRAIEIGDAWPLDPDPDPQTGFGGVHDDSVLRAILEARTIQDEDMALTPHYLAGDATMHQLVDEEGLRTRMSVPLVRGGKGIGIIVLSRREVAPFGPEDIALLDTFAEQAVIAIENVRQFKALEARLEREAATRDILEVISQSRDDDLPVFEMIAQSAARLCRSENCGLWRVENGLIEYCASYCTDPAEFETENRTPMEASAPAADNTLTGQVVKTRSVVRIMDGTAESYLEHEWVRARGLKQMVGVPIFVGGEVWGSINLMWRADQAPRDEDIQLVEGFAAQAAIAVENVRQFRAIQAANAELETRLEREKASAEILEVISQSRDDEAPVFEMILRNVARLSGTHVTSLSRLNAEGTHLELSAVWGDPLKSFRAGVDRWPLDSPIQTVQSVREARALLTADTADSDLYRAGNPDRVRLVEEEGVRSMLTVPMISAGRKAIGCLALYQKGPQPFTPDSIALVETFAAQAVIAIENVRQFRELQNRLAREAATREVLEVISRSRDDDLPVFEMLVRSAQVLCDAPISALILVRPGEDVLSLAAHCGYPDRAVGLFQSGAMRLDAGHSYAAKAIVDRMAINVSSMAESELYKANSPIVRTMVDEIGIRSAIFVPLMSGDEAIGNFSLLRFDERPFEERHVELVETFAAQAVIAIENVRQFKALEALNAELGNRVQDQVGEIERMGRLKRFLPAAVADAVVSSGSERMLKSHRALLGVLFCDIRGFTAFCETAEPEETIEVLQTYHDEMGRLIEAHGAGVDHRMGDGIMVLFNDPLPCDDPAGSAVRLAIAMRARMAELCAKWKKMGYRLGFGVGISLGYATVGMVGSGGRQDYTASGTAINMASRLCDEAQDGEILVSPRARTAVEDEFTLESRGEITFKGIREPVEVFCVTGVVS